MKLKFIGAIESVTGSKHLLMTEKGRQVLLDCGLYQGMGKETDEMNKHLGLNPSNIDAVLLSHAHIDHSGNLPSLVKQGFSGHIYCTPATYDVCKILLLDSAHIQEADIRYINKRRLKRGEPEIRPLYTVHDAEKCLKHFKTVPFDTDVQLNDELSFRFTENGHIIGSAAVHVTSRENGKTTRLTFTGDIGRYADPLLKPPAIFPQADYIISESTYGDRLHEPIGDAEGKLLEVIVTTCVQNKGRVIIPAFSLGRTQEILFMLDKLKNKNLLPDIRLFVDSPLSSQATDIVRKHPEAFNDELQAYIRKDPDPFGFSNLMYIEELEDSKALNNFGEACVIISASGMADAGRVKHHIANAVSDERNAILITGYCAPRTLGARLMNGEKEVHIFGEFHDVKAKIESILALSAHADYSEILKFLSCQDKAKVRQVFLVHGETDAKEALREKLLAAGFPQVSIPLQGESFRLD